MTEFDPNNTQFTPEAPVQGEGFTMADPNAQPFVTPDPFPAESSIPNANQLPPIDARPNVNPQFANQNPTANQLPPVDARPNVNPYSAGYRGPNGNANPYSSTQYPNHTIPGYQNSGYQQAPNQGTPMQGAPNTYGQTPYQQPVYGMEDPSKNVSTWSMVLGIVSCVIGFLGWGAIIGLGCGIAAIILGVKAGKVAPMGRRNGMATAGLICGIVGTCISGIVFCCTACTAITLGSAACAGLNSYY